LDEQNSSEFDRSAVLWAHRRHDGSDVQIAQARAQQAIPSPSFAAPRPGLSMSSAATMTPKMPTVTALLNRCLAEQPVNRGVALQILRCQGAKKMRLTILPAA